MLAIGSVWSVFCRLSVSTEPVSYSVWGLLCTREHLLLTFESSPLATIEALVTSKCPYCDPRRLTSVSLGRPVSTKMREYYRRRCDRRPHVVHSQGRLSVSPEPPVNSRAARLESFGGRSNSVKVDSRLSISP